MVIYRSVALLLVVLIFSSCKKDEYGLSVVPELTFESISPTSIEEFGGPITFNISYQDGDGDLGENDPNVKNLFLQDQRNGITYEYRIQELAPQGADIAIIGTIDIVLNTTSITDGSNEQEATFDIYAIDRAGNSSNTITSTPLTIYK